MSGQIDPEQRKKIELDYRRGYEAIAIFVFLSAAIIVAFVLTIFIL